MRLGVLRTSFSGVSRLVQGSRAFAVLVLIAGTAAQTPQPTAAQLFAKAFQQGVQEVADGQTGQAMQDVNRAGIEAGMGSDQIKAAIEKMKEIGLQWNKEQTPSGTFTVDLGTVYPGVPYLNNFPVTNGCHSAQEATITYPNPMPLTSVRHRRVVPVPPLKTVLEPMQLKYPPDPPDAYEYPVCTLHVGELTAHHSGGLTVEDTAAGTLTYNCHEADRKYIILVCVEHGPGGGGGGGGGKPKPAPKKGSLPPLDLVSSVPRSPCERLWNQGVFVSSSPITSADQCLAYLQEQAHLLFDDYLKSNRAADPLGWAWVPTGAAIDGLSVQQILLFRQQVITDLLQSGA